MTAHCEYCPFPGCDSCAYKGGETVTAQRDSGASEGADERLSEYTWGEHGTAPTGEFAPHQPGPDRDSTPTSGRGNRG